MNRLGLQLLAVALTHVAAIAADPAPTPSERLKNALAAAGKGDFGTALGLLRSEADRGSAEAANALGELLLAGRGGKPEPEEAAKYFQQASEAGNPAGSYQLARLLERGVGIARDDDRARFLIQSAAELGHAPAQARQGAILEAGADRSNERRGYEDARTWYEKAAAQNEPSALLALSRFFDAGLGGLPVNVEKATDYCERAAQAGSAVAMNEMAVRYQKGTGIRQDAVAAVGWLTRAAQHRLPAAMVNLGYCYENGNGVLVDFGKAGEYYAAAARQHFALGEFFLGKLFQQGRGTARDEMKAFVLFARAAEHGLEQAVTNRDEAKRKLSKQQLEEAAALLEAERKVRSEGGD